MIREDYIIAWIKRYVRLLAEIIGLVKTADYEQAIRRIDLALRDILNLGTDSVQSLSDGEILARLTMGEPPQLVQERCVVIAALLRQLGLIAAAEGKQDLARDCHLKCLHIVLGLKLRPDVSELPEYAPSIEELASWLKEHDLPPRTYAGLMLHFEANQEFAKAEDALFEMIGAAANNVDALDTGSAFYDRIRALSDDVLELGGLPRVELESGRSELLEKRRAMAGR